MLVDLLIRYVRPRVCFWPIHVFVTRAPQIRELALNTELSNESACSLNTLICLAIPCIDIYLPIIVRSLHTYLQPSSTPSNQRLVIMAPTCGYCGKSGPNLKQCSACKFMKYCNVSCQRLHWKNHKEECSNIKNIVDSTSQLSSQSSTPVQLIHGRPRHPQYQGTEADNIRLKDALHSCLVSTTEETEES